MIRPGEVSLAHNGVLYLDELPKFSSASIAAVSDALHDGASTIMRRGQSTGFPADPFLVAAANPCPCGFSSSILHDCSDSDAAKKQYQARTNKAASKLGIKLRVELQPQTPRELKHEPVGETSEEVRERVTRSQDLQLKRYGNLVCKTGMPLLDALAVVIATLDGRAVPDSNDDSLAAELFGLENNNQDAVEGRR